MKRRTLVWLILALVIFGGGAWMAQETNLFGGITLSPRAKQLDYLKEHEEELVKFVKSKNSKIESVQMDWNSLTVEQIGNGTPQGGGYNLSVKGSFNHIKDSDFTVDFPLENENAIPSIDLIGMLNPPSVLKNGGWDKFE
ncbi:hypothetical protein [Streptococcus sp. CF10-1]|uniref:hypothetical protein n=1 Tax=Streptococcus sp. CF10-1 TaxID=2963162 RepID=UPI0020C83CFB|nr:hypothetical protein [Streptococcus sp. CF10-1]MCP9082987.1 hypothetical protein [Streptococcus sp. CF10-1]